MSIAENPLLGPMSKSMGNFTTTSYHGKNIIRSKAFHKKDAKSEKQLNHRMKISLIAEVYGSFGGMTKMGFPENNYGKSPYNMFLAANLSTAFDLTGEVPVINYPLLVVSKGTMPKVKVTESVVGIEGITLRYETAPGTPKVSANDELIGMAKLKNGGLLIDRHARGTEETGTLVLKYPNVDIEEIECCYVFARSADGKMASNSTYVQIDRSKR